MKNLILVIGLSLLATCALADVSAYPDPAHPGMKLVVFSGGEGNAAAALYNQLSAVTETTDNSTAGEVDTYRMGAALSCEKTVVANQAATYKCSTDMTTNGTFVIIN